MNLKKGDIIVIRNEKGKVVESVIKTLILILASTFVCWQIWQIRVVANRMLAQQQLEFTILCQQLSTSCSETN
jgi:hypothetical protein